jgi:polysaccharide export outer membrane protein
MNKKWMLSVCLLALSVTFVQAESPKSQLAGTSSGSTVTASPAIEIGAGDVLDVKVYDVPELSGEFRVSQDGYIDIPLIHKIRVIGLTADESASLIAQRFKSGGFVLHPQVMVAVVQYTSQGADLMGEVRKPGIYPTLGTRRLLDMLTLAGGVTPSAGNLVTIIHRKDPHHPVYLALAQSAAGYRLQRNPVILPGDTIIVQKSGIVYIMGAVGRPGGYLVNNNEPLTLMEAISLAGGTTVTSKIKEVRLIRKVHSGKEIVRLNLDKIYKGKEADVAVNDGDIVFVPTSAVKSFIYQGFGGISSIANTANSTLYAVRY